MQLDSGLILNSPYYIAPNKILFCIDSFYTFTVELADSSKYVSTIRTQKQNIYSLSAPNSIRPKDSLPVTWLAKDTTGWISISYGWGVVTVAHPDSGSYTFPAGFFADTSNAPINLTLSSVKSGTINSAFMQGSIITSTINISRTVQLTQ